MDHSERVKTLSPLRTQEDEFKEKVRVLLCHIENVLDDENWERISVKAWNDVSLDL